MPHGVTIGMFDGSLQYRDTMNPVFRASKG